MRAEWLLLHRAQEHSSTRGYLFASRVEQEISPTTLYASSLPAMGVLVIWALEV